MLFDAAKYTVAAGAMLKYLCPKLFHVTFVPHLLQNCAMKVKSHFGDVDELIAIIKSVTIKNKTRQIKFASIGCSSQPLVTRWGSRLNAGLYYVKNLPEIKAILEVLKGLVFSNSSKS